MRLTKAQRLKIIEERGMTTLRQKEKKQKREEVRKRYLSSLNEVPCAVLRGEVRRNVSFQTV